MYDGYIRNILVACPGIFGILSKDSKNPPELLDKCYKLLHIKCVDKKKILKELKALLVTEFSGEIHKVILFGSQAIDDANDYSDYDILVIMEKGYDWKLKDAILACCYEIDLKYDILTDVKLISKSDLQTIKGKQPFVLSALTHGIAI
jgi:predicted nucleotidyltransferase